MTESGTSVGKIPIICINLLRREDRWVDFIKQEGLHGLDIKRWNAVDGATIDYINDPRVSMRVKRNIIKKLRRSWDDIYTPGALGCYLSHLEIWRWLAKSDSIACVVLEDDCVVPSDFSDKLRHLWEESAIIRDGRFDCCILHRKCGEVAQGNMEGDKMIEPMEIFFNTTGYIITRSCALKLVENALPIQVHVDKYIGLYKKIYNLKIYRVQENWLSITSSGSVSDIDSKNCEFCNIPSDFTNTHRSLGLYDFYLGRASQGMALVMIGWWGLTKAGII